MQHSLLLKVDSTKRRKAFTLIELSVVIVIITLIIAGVSAGRGLVEQSKLRKIITDLQTYRIAITSFKLQYNKLPGDINNASSYWGTWNESASSGAINGDGDGIVEQNSEDPSVWHHLYLAGLIQFNNSNQLKSYISGSYERTDKNEPPGPLINTYYRFAGNYDYSDWHKFYAEKYPRNGLFFTSIPVTNKTGGSLQYTSLLSRQAEEIDRKIDDGIANKGMFLGSGGADRYTAINMNDSQSCSLAAYSASPTSNVSYKNRSSNTINCFVGYFF